MRLNNIEKKYNLNVNLYIKVEFSNPTGSVKVRIALSMIETEERQGKIQRDSVIIEPTSGITGIGLASVCTAK